MLDSVVDTVMVTGQRWWPDGGLTRTNISNDLYLTNNQMMVGDK